jgi:hypothetical protein
VGFNEAKSWKLAWNLSNFLPEKWWVKKDGFSANLGHKLIVGSDFRSLAVGESEWNAKANEMLCR